MSRDSSRIECDGKQSLSGSNQSTSSSNSQSFMEIRLRSLSKAIDEVKKKRVRLEQDLRLGNVPESEYASSLLKLIVESNTLSKEQEGIAEQIKVLRNKSIIHR